VDERESMEIVSRLQDSGTFTGGPPELFHVAGKKQLMILRHFGMTEKSKVLDIGCGCLRGGRWVIPELNQGHYFGIEVNKEMLEKGLEICVEKEIVSEKKPKFDNNSDFDFGIFGERFDFFFARSIWSHASKIQIEKMLDQFLVNKTAQGIFLTSYHRSRFPYFGEYQGKEWVGKSDSSDEAGVVRHSLRRIRKLCKVRGLHVEEFTKDPFDFGLQRWLVIKSL